MGATSSDCGKDAWKKGRIRVEIGRLGAIRCRLSGEKLLREKWVGNNHREGTKMPKPACGRLGTKNKVAC